MEKFFIIIAVINALSAGGNLACDNNVIGVINLITACVITALLMVA